MLFYISVNSLSFLSSNDLNSRTMRFEQDELPVAGGSTQYLPWGLGDLFCFILHLCYPI